MAALLHFRKSRNNYDKRYNNPESGKIRKIIFRTTKYRRYIEKMAYLVVREINKKLFEKKLQIPLTF